MSAETQMKIDMRVVKTKLGVYIRAEDVVYMIRDFVSSEETDVRNRGYELARNIENRVNQCTV